MPHVDIEMAVVVLTFDLELIELSYRREPSFEGYWNLVVVFVVSVTVFDQV